MAEVSSGHLRAGECLPAERDMVNNLGISRGTIRQALDALEREGVISRKPRKGTVVNDASKRFANQRGKKRR